MKTKFRLIFLPFVLITIVFVIVYTFLDWLIIVNNQIVGFNIELINYWIPFAISCIIWLLILNPRIKILKQFGYNGLGIIAMVAIFSMTVPILNAQDYIQESSGRLTHLNHISQIDKGKKAKYYTLNNFYTTRKNIGVYSASEISGRYGENLDFTIYIALPLYDSISDTSQSQVKAWLAIDYYDRIDNNGDQSAKDAAFNAFYNQSLIDFQYKNLPDFVYLERMTSDYGTEDYIKAVQRSPKYLSGELITVLGPINKPFEARTGDEFEWIFLSFGIGVAIMAFFLFILQIDDEKLKEYQVKKNPNFNSIKFLIPNERIFITPILIWVNFLVFIVMVFNGADVVSVDSKMLIDWGGNYAPLTFNGQIWRLLTYMFLHEGLMHIVNNMVGLFLAGFILEPILGRLKFISVYFISGIFSGTVSALWHNNIVAIGASGAIFGLYGILLVLLIEGKFKKGIIDNSLLVFVIIFIVLNLYLGMFGIVDNAAHVGGLISGILLGIAVYPSLKNHIEVKKKNLHPLKNNDALEANNHID